MKKKSLGQKIIEALQEAVLHNRGERKLRTTTLVFGDSSWYEKNGKYYDKETGEEVEVKKSDRPFSEVIEYEKNED